MVFDHVLPCFLFLRCILGPGRTATTSMSSQYATDSGKEDLSTCFLLSLLFTQRRSPPCLQLIYSDSLFFFSSWPLAFHRVAVCLIMQERPCRGVPNSHSTQLAKGQGSRFRSSKIGLHPIRSGFRAPAPSTYHLHVASRVSSFAWCTRRC